MPRTAEQVAADVASDAEVALGAAQLAREAAKEAVAAKPPPPDPRNAPHFELLQHGERTALARISPRRNRWPALQALDARIADNDRHQGEVAAALTELRERRVDSDSRHQVAVADWFAVGQDGPRPVCDAAELDEQIAALEPEHAAFNIIRERLLDERVAFVRKHRKRLVRDSRKGTAERLERYLALVDELEEVRADLIASRATDLWAELYPSESLASDPPFLQVLVGARLRLQERHLPGCTMQLPAHSVFGLLRDDARHCATVATTDQAAEAEGVSRSVLTGRDALWAGSDEARERERREKAEALEAYRLEWGAPPAEYF